MEKSNIEKKYRPLIVVATIAIPLVVALLFNIRIEGYDFSFLPPIYAAINGLTALLLVLAVVSIKKGNRKLHQRLIQLSILCSLLFLVGYILYHATSEMTVYGDLDGNKELSEQELADAGMGRLIYVMVLISHIFLSVLIIPLVLTTYIKGWANNLTSHKKWAKFTFPLWLYVAISGVVVYLMISPYY